METAFTGSHTLGDIVSTFPGASHLFKEMRIDFCCGGDRKLSAVLQEQQLAEASFIETLNQMFNEAKKDRTSVVDWSSLSNSDLIDHIVHTHHAYLVKELPVLSELVTKILRVHGAQHGGVLSKVHQLYHMLKIEFDQHLIAEEQTVFPLIKEYDSKPGPALQDKIRKAIVILEADHSGVGDFLREIRDITDDYTLPPDACTTYALTFKKLDELETDTFQHVHLENNILFSRV